MASSAYLELFLEGQRDRSHELADEYIIDHSATLLRPWVCFDNSFVSASRAARRLQHEETKRRILAAANQCGNPSSPPRKRRRRHDSSRNIQTVYLVDNFFACNSRRVPCGLRGVTNLCNLKTFVRIYRKPCRAPLCPSSCARPSR